MTATTNPKSKKDFAANGSKKENAPSSHGPAATEENAPALTNPKTGAPSHNVEIAPGFWAEFFASLKRSTYFIHIRVSQENASTRDIANNVPLRRVLMEHQNDGCNSMLVIETGEDYERPARHEIVEPFQLWLENRGGDRFGRLQIRAESGTTSIDFHPLLTYERHT